jgi:hypothetical protein
MLREFLGHDQPRPEPLVGSPFHPHRPQAPLDGDPLDLADYLRRLRQGPGLR